MSNNVGIALLLTAAAGLSTTIGSVLGLVMQKPGARFMSFVLGFSAGVMIMVSFVELLQGSIEHIGFLSANLGFFAGIISMFLIDYFIPHEYIGQRDFHQKQSNSKLLRAGLLVALGIGIHNFPEGMATFAGALQDVRLGGAIAVAIAIHNIPEGLAGFSPCLRSHPQPQESLSLVISLWCSRTRRCSSSCSHLIPIFDSDCLRLDSSGRGWNYGFHITR